MHPIYFSMGIMALLLFIIVGLITCMVLFVKRKKRKQKVKFVVISIVVNIFLLLFVSLYAASHSTYYKYNDWVMLTSNIHMVEQKYGEFDLGEIKDNEKGRVAYYTYTDNGPIMPDHLKHYYYIEYDEWGVIYNVYDGCQPGGTSYFGGRKK